MIKTVLLLGVLVGVVIGAGAAARVPAPLVQVGQVYAIVVSCDAASTRCLMELHRVTAILDGSWVETRQCADETCAKAPTTWKLNLAHVYALRPYTWDGRAAD